MLRIFTRTFTTTSWRLIKQIQQTCEGDLITVSVVDVPEKPNTVYLKTACNPGCCICNSKLKKLAYNDVLILEQFMREDGTVLPSELSGICETHQEILERCVMQAHWSGLFPDRTTADFDRSGYKRFNRWWRSSDEIFNLSLKQSEGSWHYVKRYNPKKLDLKKS